jgi:hypothetical protein
MWKLHIHFSAYNTDARIILSADHRHWAAPVQMNLPWFLTLPDTGSFNDGFPHLGAPDSGVERLASRGMFGEEDFGGRVGMLAQTPQTGKSPTHSIIRTRV